jgi:hypothetical protein
VLTITVNLCLIPGQTEREKGKEGDWGERKGEGGREKEERELKT